MTHVRPTVKDVSRAIAVLEDCDCANPAGHLPRVASNLAYVAGPTVNIFKVSKRDVSLMLASHGASAMTIERYAGKIARTMRSDFANHSWSGTI
jgi:hypothetical protein